MAVGFFVDDGEDHLNSPYPTSVITTVHSATQTPLQSPVSREYLVQAFCEALQRVNITSSPGIITSPPPSPSCSHPNANGDVFFPRGNSSSGSGSSSSSMQPSTPSSIRMHDDYRSAQWSPRTSSVPRRRYRLTSASDEDEYDDDIHPFYDDFDVSQHMAERERLQEFTGRIPERKKRDSVNRQPRKSRDPKMWPAVAVTAVVLAVGCGFLVSR